MSLAKRISKDPEKRRSEFIEAAERLFTAKGYEETTVSDIVKEVNVAQGIFYSYSGSKGEVLEAMIEEDLAVLEDKVTGILERHERELREKAKRCGQQHHRSQRRQERHTELPSRGEQRRSPRAPGKEDHNQAGAPSD